MKYDKGGRQKSSFFSGPATKPLPTSNLVATFMGEY